VMWWTRLSEICFARWRIFVVCLSLYRTLWHSKKNFCFRATYVSAEYYRNVALRHVRHSAFSGSV